MSKETRTAVRLLIHVVGLLCASSSIAAQDTASLAGSVVDEANNPVAGAQVICRGLQKFVRDPAWRLVPVGPFVSRSVVTGSDGRFLASGLPAGEYRLCAIRLLPNQLNSCQWGGASPAIPVPAGQAVTGQKLTLRTGTLITLEVQDPNGHLAAGKKFLLGVVRGVGEYHRAQLASKAPGLHTYAVAVPRNASLSLLLDTPLDVRDSMGQALESRRLTHPISTASQAALAFRLVVR